MSALSAMQDKTQHLENSLSAETRIKLDLFSALGDAKRQLEIAQGRSYFPTTLNTFCEHSSKYLGFWTIFLKPSCTWTDMLVSVFRSDPAEGPGDKRSKAEDSRSYGRHAQHLLHSRHQQHDSRDAPLFLQVHGHQSLWPRPQRLRLPATQKVNASSCSRLLPPSILSFFFFFPPLQAHHLPICSAEHCFFSWVFISPPCQVRRMLYCVTVFVVVKTKDKKNLKRTSHVN